MFDSFGIRFVVRPVVGLVYCVVIKFQNFSCLGESESGVPFEKCRNPELRLEMNVSLLRF